MKTKMLRGCASPIFRESAAYAHDLNQVAGGRFLRVPKLSSRACGPRNPMKIVQSRAIIHDGSYQGFSSLLKARYFIGVIENNEVRPSPRGGIPMSLKFKITFELLAVIDNKAVTCYAPKKAKGDRARRSPFVLPTSRLWHAERAEGDKVTKTIFCL
jgi:hypothetical protein